MSGLFYRGIIKEDIINSYKSIHATIFFQGCSHHCEGCFNPESWEFEPKEERFKFTEEKQQEFIEVCKRPWIEGISLSGGDPLDQNIDELYKFLEKLDQLNKPIYCWTGYKFEDLVKEGSEKLKVLNFIDYLIDGEFMYKNKKEIPLRGSTNQRVIDVKKSLENNKVQKAEFVSEN